MSAVPTTHRPPWLLQPFRLLFAGASLWASAGMSLWAGFLHLGWLPATTLSPLLWHGHEMLFGFGGALMAGFLLTAVANWTGMPTSTPPSLALLVALWLAARLAFLLPALPYAVSAALDCTFFPLLGALVARPLLQARDRRNLFLIPLLLALALADLLFHLAAAGRLRLPADRVLGWAIDLLTVLMLVIGGRIIPFFTTRRLSAVHPRRRRALDWSVNGGALLMALIDVAAPSSAWLGGASLLLAILVLLRLWGWQPWRSWREPMLWVLHLGYLWLAAGLGLRAVALLSGGLPEITALHALTVGALGSLAIGMMTRVGLGHTGRRLHAGNWMTAAFLLVQAAALLRVGADGNLLPLAASLWTLAFAIYFLRFLPVHFGPLRV